MTSKSDDLFNVVEGVFYRAVDPIFAGSSLHGSRHSGRYSRADQPTLYLSSSPEGVEAAMKAHAHARAAHLQLIRVHVIAHHIFDLRNVRLCATAGVSLHDASAPWQELVAKGERPPSWDVRDRLVRLGAKGLIDPSRTAPRLWHLVLFEWNTDGAPTVRQFE